MLPREALAIIDELRDELRAHDETVSSTCPRCARLETLVFMLCNLYSVSDDNDLWSTSIPYEPEQREP